jgi:hypothetical protein
MNGLLVVGILMTCSPVWLPLRHHFLLVAAPFQYCNTHNKQTSFNGLFILITIINFCGLLFH